MGKRGKVKMRLKNVKKNLSYRVCSVILVMKNIYEIPFLHTSSASQYKTVLKMLSIQRFSQ